MNSSEGNGSAGATVESTIPAPSAGFKGGVGPPVQRAEKGLVKAFTSSFVACPTHKAQQQQEPLPGKMFTRSVQCWS